MGPILRRGRSALGVEHVAREVATPSREHLARVGFSPFLRTPGSGLPGRYCDELAPPLLDRELEVLDD
jgi:hypothetical protein